MSYIIKVRSCNSRYLQTSKKEDIDSYHAVDKLIRTSAKHYRDVK